jgi:SIR2-like protein
MHDAGRHVAGLRLSLAQDKAPLALLLAAGCSAGVKGGDDQPLIPAVAGMTSALRARIEASVDNERFQRLLICLTEDGNDEPNLEDWLSTVRALRAVAAGAPVRGLAKDDLDALETAITSGIVTLVDRELPGAETPFHAVASWARAIERELPVELFTTNYDLLLEAAFEQLRAPLFDGFVGARRPFFDIASVQAGALPPIPARFTRLWKLHGSVNWFLSDGGDVIRENHGQGSRRLIHPSHLKYDESRQMPYLALLDRLRAYLSLRGALLVTCGYSFRDDHINAVLAEALAANATGSLIGLMHSNLDSYPKAVMLAQRHPNMVLYAREGAVIGTRRDPWTLEGGAVPTGIVGIEDDGDDLGQVEVKLGSFDCFGALLTGLLGPSRPDSDER